MKSCSFFLSILAIASSAHASSMEPGGRGPGLKTLSVHTATDEVRNIALTQDRVLAATRGGVSVHDRSSGRFLFVLTTRHGLACNSSTALLPLENGDVLVGGEFGVSRLRNVSGSIAATEVSVAQVLTGARADLYDPVIRIQRRDDGIYVFGQRSGPRRYDPKRLELAPASADRIAWADGIPTYHGWWFAGITGRLEHRIEGKVTETLDLAEPVLEVADEEPYLLVATGERLLRVEHGRLRELRALDTSGPIRAVAFSSTLGRETLVATRDGHIHAAVDGVLTELTKIEGEPTAIQADGSLVWTGLRGEGLTRIDLDRQTVLSVRQKGEICSNHVTHLTRHAGALVVGTFDQGACAWVDGEWRGLNTASRFILGIASDGENLYIASSNGISRFNRHFDEHPIGRRDARALRWLANTAATGAAELGDGQVALSSAYGIVRLQRRRDGRTRATFFDRSDGRVPLKIVSLASSGSELFVASETQGVSRLGWSHEKPRRYLDPIALPEAWVTAVSASSSERLWVGTCQNGVAWINGNRSILIQERNGLPDDRITAVASANHGAFVGTLWGIAYVSQGGEVTVYGQRADPRSSGMYREGTTLWHATEAGLVAFRIESPQIVVAKHSE